MNKGFFSRSSLAIAKEPASLVPKCGACALGGSMSVVKYATIDRFPHYRIGDDGSVWSCKVQGSKTGKLGKWKRMKPPIRKDGYASVILNKTTALIHHLVLEAFVGPCPPGMECCHEDRNRSNNCLTNLRWDTHSQNCQDAINHGTFSRGELHGKAKLTESNVHTIRRLLKQGTKPIILAKRFGVSRDSIYNIKSGASWKWLKERAR